MGSGFFVKDNIVATNFHVIENSFGGYAKLVGSEKQYRITGVVGIDKAHDLALLHVEGVKGKILPFSMKNIEIGDQVYALGNPLGLEGTFSEGIISGLRKFEDDQLLQTTVPISPGSSGGPILNKNGEVIGVAVATLTGGQNLNFAIPVSYVEKLLNQDEKDNPIELSLINYNLFARENEIIPPGLAKRVEGSADPSVKELTTKKKSSYPTYVNKPYTKVEFRVLDFEYADF